nr:hypothetical protein [Deltaproteobacteria bacterium]
MLALSGACKQRETRPAAPIDAPIDAAIDAPAIVVDAPAPPRLTVTRIVAGADSTCAIMSNRTLRCWGRNDHGQLGDGTTTDAATPVTPELRGVMDVQLAGRTACALLDDNSVACWGHIAWLGTKPDTLRPTGLLGVKGVKQLFVLERRACGRVADDSLVCWGGIAPGARFTTQGLEQRHYPTPSSELVAITALDATAARTDDGTVWMWNPTDGTPVKTDLVGAREIDEREGTVCARQETGITSCAGERLACLPALAPPKPAPAKK